MAYRKHTESELKLHCHIFQTTLKQTTLTRKNAGILVLQCYSEGESTLKENQTLPIGYRHHEHVPVVTKHFFFISSNFASPLDPQN